MIYSSSAWFLAFSAMDLTAVSTVYVGDVQCVTTIIYTLARAKHGYHSGTRNRADRSKTVSSSTRGVPVPKSEHIFSRNVGRSLKKRSRSFRERERCFFDVYKNPSPVSSEMSIDCLSSSFGASAEKFALKFHFTELECCFFFVYKNPSPDSSKISIDRSSSDFGAFVNKCALKTDYLELVNRPGSLLFRVQ
ncbi:hypothetical protein TSAR_012368 [Trichomalopsis sarcophagae]|uniref:Uncharacterized protein n=1 Tax=Trichomalopsis sarcophagae TaxID=543379 RepID=A0A232EI04_9HYME|nr:hypothetical protein TSAR_012368 [Trichomalopsis sarcophagae]